jgi:hypothetical protein
VGFFSHLLPRNNDKAEHEKEEHEKEEQDTEEEKAASLAENANSLVESKIGSSSGLEPDSATNSATVSDTESA